MIRKKWVTRLTSIVCILTGGLFLFYPWISNYYVDRQAMTEVSIYETQVADENTQQTASMLYSAMAYNEILAMDHIALTDPFVNEDPAKELSDYERILSFDEQGMIGYLEIPKINVKLCIYHGTDEGVLEKGVGHLKGSSLPVGGDSTHAVLCGHTGRSEAKLFTDLNLLGENDLFSIHVLDHILTYRIENMVVVEPSDIQYLNIRPGEDLCTLVTCTPYGINSHRLLVTGRRTADPLEVNEMNANRQKHQNRDSEWMRDYRRAVCLGVLILTGVILFLYPVCSHLKWKKQTEDSISSIREHQSVSSDRSDAGGADEDDPLFLKMYEYNAYLYESGQEGMRSIRDLEEMPAEFAGENTSEAFGYIEIPAMKVRLPLFLGADDEHLAKGAAVLGQTSVPIGGKNTNAVIAGHRGYRGNPYFLDIEKLNLDDPVYITNRWETLTYYVADVRIIDPEDTGALLIRENKDMVTLLTCHPYRSHGKYRYLVYCEREETDAGMTEDTDVKLQMGEAVENGSFSAAYGADRLSSGFRIQCEKILWISGLACIIVLIIRTLCFRYRRKDSGCEQTCRS